MKRNCKGCNRKILDQLKSLVAIAFPIKKGQTVSSIEVEKAKFAGRRDGKDGMADQSCDKADFEISFLSSTFHSTLKPYQKMGAPPQFFWLYWIFIYSVFPIALLIYAIKMYQFFRRSKKRDRRFSIAIVSLIPVIWGTVYFVYYQLYVL
jgi:hypothetical protein